MATGGYYVEWERGRRVLAGCIDGDAAAEWRECGSTLSLSGGTGFAEETADFVEVRSLICAGTANGAGVVTASFPGVVTDGV